MSPRRKAFSAIRKGIVEHVLAGRLRATSFAVYVWLHLQADHVKGTVWTNATRLAIELSLDASVVRRTLMLLQRDGYIRSAAVPGSRQLYEIGIVKYHEHFEEDSVDARQEVPQDVPQEAPQERGASARQRERNATRKKKEEPNHNKTYPTGVTRLR